MEIKFIANSKETEVNIPRPKPAKHCLPDWYRDKKMFDGDEPYIRNSAAQNLTMKGCVPVADAMGGGYIQETWCDLYIEYKNNNLHIDTPLGPPMVNFDGSPSQMPVPPEYHDLSIAWIRHWQPITPKGYSLLITHPFNRFDLPFQVTSAIVDFDNFHHRKSGNIPFLLRGDFHGIIKAGTPMYQMLPIKRDAWRSTEEPYDEDAWAKLHAEGHRKFFGVYKNYFHTRKDYK